MNHVYKTESTLHGMKTHVLSFMLWGLLGILTVHCDKDSPTGILDDDLVGRWTLSSVQVGYDQGYGEPFSPEEIGVFITFVFGSDGTFQSDYVYESDTTSLYGSWITQGSTLIIRYDEGSKISGRYSVSDTEFRFTFVGTMPNITYSYLNISAMSYIFIFMSE